MAHVGRVANRRLLAETNVSPHLDYRDLNSALSEGALVTDHTVLPEYGRDFWASRGVPWIVVRPRVVEDVVATLRFAYEREIPVVPRAAGTNIGAGFLPGLDRILLDLRTLDRILAIDSEMREARVQPGLINGELQSTLAPLGLCFSPDPASAPLSTIGGNIAENAGGPHCLKYGVTFHHIRAVDVVLADGTCMHVTDTNSGPDLLGVLIGSEGTLGVITEAHLRLRSLPEATHTVFAAFRTVEAAAEAATAILSAGVNPAALEFFDRAAAQLFQTYQPTGYPEDAVAFLLIDVDGGLDQVIRDGLRVQNILRVRTGQVRFADTPEVRAALWRGRLSAGKAQAHSGKKHFIGDSTVPRSQVPALLRAVEAIRARHDVSIHVLGHAGDGNLHPNIAYDLHDRASVARMEAASHDLLEATLQLGGTLTGEHGVGSEKREMLRRRCSPAEIAAMRAVKTAFDPTALLNPGVLLPAVDQHEPVVPEFAAAVHRALVSDPRHAGRPGISSDTEAHNGVCVHPEDLTLTVGAACTPNDARVALGDFALCCPALDHLRPDVPIVTALAAGNSRLLMRDALLAVDALLVDGQRVRFGSDAIKDVAGYDLKRLFHGGAGAFGPLRGATLRLWPCNSGESTRMSQGKNVRTSRHEQ